MADKTREIKFRFWDKKKKEWVTDAWVIVEVGKPWLLENNGEVNKSKNLILTQWTGLLDKNGKEIFEGDIVECCGQKGWIEWDNDEARWLFVYEEGGEEFADSLSIITEEYEILGNLYESPHLVDKKSANIDI